MTLSAGSRGQALKEASLDRNNHQGWYGECFVRVLAAAAGLRVARPEPAVDGIDFHLSWIDRSYDDYTVTRIQVKSSSVLREDDGPVWKFRLTEPHFNALAGNSTVPAFLFLVKVPADAAGYALADPRWLRLSHACYWASLGDRPKITAPSANRYVRVVVPKQNLLTTRALTELCAGSAVPEAGITGPARVAGTL